MKLSGILAQLDSVYVSVGSGLNPQLIESVGDVNKYLYHHLDVGYSDDNNPVAYKSHKAIYVYKEGTDDEAAYHERFSPKSKVDKGTISSTPSSPRPEEIYAVYSSEPIRNKIRGLIIRAAYDIYNEDAGVANHSLRMQWATNAIRNVENHTDGMMAFVSMNSTVLGGEHTDEDLRFIVNSNIDKWATTIYTA